MDEAMTELPRYRCHKEVWALKIGLVVCDRSGGALLVPEDTTYGSVEVSREYVERHHPHSPGYYVVYKDGYTSWSPVDAFEEGYTRMEDQ